MSGFDVRWWLLAVVIAGCGRVGFQRDEDARTSDAGADASRPDAGSMDAGSDAGRDAGMDGGRDGGIDSGPPDAGTIVFMPPGTVASLNSTGSDTDPSLTGDELEIFFVSDRSGSTEIWTATRATTAADWNAPVLAAALNSTSIETDPDVSADGLHVFFSSQRGGNNDLWQSSRATRTGAWSAPSLVTELNTTSAECCAVISDDGLRLLFATDRGAGGNADIYRASRATTAMTWSGIGEQFDLDTSSAESNPHWMPDELLVVFDSDRGISIGMRDIFLAIRPSTAGSFASAMQLIEVSSTADDRDPWISRDGRRIWFASNRSGNYDILAAAR